MVCQQTRLTTNLYANPKELFLTANISIKEHCIYISERRQYSLLRNRLLGTGFYGRRCMGDETAR